MKRNFRIGEKVRLKGSFYPMRVLQYVKSSNKVKCWWKHEKFGYLTSEFDEGELIKIKKTPNRDFESYWFNIPNNEYQENLFS